LGRELGAHDALLERAEAQLGEAEGLLAVAPAALAETLLARAALHQARGESQACFDAAERALAEAHGRGEFPVLVQALSACAEAARALGNSELVHLRYSELRALLDSAALTLTAAERALLRNVRGYRAALAATPARSAVRAEVDTRFGQLTQYVKRLTSETRLPRLYERILEAAIALSGAERGLLLRPDLQGRVRARAQLGAANAEPQSLATAVWSQSIVDRVLRSGQLLASVDAAEDQQLLAASSVHALALRSVLALPMRTHDAVLGVIYLEDRLRPFAFGEAEIALLSDFADLASMTITGVERLRRERRAVRRLSLTQARLAAEVQTQAIELRALKQAHEPLSERTGIVAESPAMRESLSLALRVAASDVPVLIRGESGTGKELVARAIHTHSARRDRPFVTESCGAIPETLLESALFGHVKGAFTGADRRRVGLFEAANGGTLFLDEIAEMSAAMQTRLLRVLQEGEVRPLGGERTLRVDVRVLAATHRDVEAMVADGSFREDLFYRLAVVDLRLPPLRERASDVIPLVQHFMLKHAAGRTPRLERRAIERLMTSAWPGNVRQLENEVRRALVLGGDVLREEHFGISQAKEGSSASSSDLNLRGQVDDLERKLIKRAMELAKGNQTRAAELLGVSRFGLQKMIKRLGIASS
jgi:transcriptional regulator with GAF, ATPase, and Fis domain